MWEMKGWECKKELKAKQSKCKRCGRLSNTVSAWCVVWLRKKALYQGPSCGLYGVRCTRAPGLYHGE